MARNYSEYSNDGIRLEKLHAVPENSGAVFRFPHEPWILRRIPLRKKLRKIRVLQEDRKLKGRIPRPFFRPINR
ncbi:MAG: hypothetical protein NTU59_00270, partial [Coprothermobacterota bacterium]|nr:hypothetical protein [Coprothermobacterota bacterium]